MKIKKLNFLSLSCSFVILIFFLEAFACIQTLHARQDAIESKTQNFVVASSNNFPPMNELDQNGNLTGFGKELSSAVINAIGGKVSYIHSAHWVQVLEWLDSGRADLIHDTGYTKDRDEFLDYTTPIIEMPEVIFVRSDQYDITDFNSLKGKTVACVNKHITHLYLQKFPEINCYVVKTPVQGLYELLAGKVDAFVYPKQIVLYLIQNLRLGDKIKITGDHLRTLTWSMVVKEGNKEVLELLNKGIAIIKKNGEYKRIYNKWWGKKILAGYSKRELYVIVAVTTGISIVLVLLILLLLFNRSLYKSKRILDAEIEERKKTEKAIKESEKRLRGVFESKIIGILFWDVNGEISDANNAFLEIVGYTRDDLLSGNVPWKNMTPPEYKEQDDNALLELSERGVTTAFEKEYFRKDGSRIPILLSATTLPGATLNGAAFVIDITERKKAEEELKKSNETLEAAQSMAKVGYWSFDIKTQTPTWSKQMFDVFGVDPQKGASNFENHKEIWHPDDWEPFVKAVSNCGTDGKSYNMVVRIIFPDKSMHFVHTQGFPRFNEEGDIVELYGTSQDITERLRAEKELQKMQKLESIGVLAGGIAHDFNNILAGIITNIYLSKKYVQKESEGLENLKKAEKAIFRARNLTQRLLTFAKGGVPIIKVVAIDKTIKESSEFVLTGSNVTCDYHIANDLWTVKVDEGQMGQVIQNIILNSIQAMPNGGTIHINIDNIELAAEEPPLKEGLYVKIMIKDEGTGISQEHINKIFDPFFTTKDMGQGLGLSITHSIIKNHNGHISVRSEVETGTTFTIYLPASDKPIDVKEIEDGTVLEGHGKILLMDDEKIIREAIGQFLEISGYEMKYAENGNEAIALYENEMKAKRPFDAVILDLTIRGGMGGKETIEKLLDIDPEVKAIVSSGFSNDPIMANFREYGFMDVLVKPFDDPNELIMILHKILNVK